MLCKIKPHIIFVVWETAQVRLFCLVLCFSSSCLLCFHLVFVCFALLRGRRSFLFVLVKQSSLGVTSFMKALCNTRLLNRTFCRVWLLLYHSIVQYQIASWDILQSLSTLLLYRTISYILFYSILGCVLPLQEVALRQSHPSFSVLCYPRPYRSLFDPQCHLSNDVLVFQLILHPLSATLCF